MTPNGSERTAQNKMSYIGLLIAFNLAGNLIVHGCNIFLPFLHQLFIVTFDVDRLKGIRFKCRILLFGIKMLFCFCLSRVTFCTRFSVLSKIYDIHVEININL